MSKVSLTDIGPTGYRTLITKKTQERPMALLRDCLEGIGLCQAVAQEGGPKPSPADQLS